MNRMIKYMASIAESLHGIHRELIILNKSNPSQQAKKNDERVTKELKPNKFI
ncbi:hypothetical protein [Staphylococcus equorum]|uniref:hypothetical protein n=1 Tax=Staphylococcus equorum TaxID=246432 RepID=UPI000AEA43E3|nr:hypothetical protein [Staphylococcus equorum]